MSTDIPYEVELADMAIDTSKWTVYGLEKAATYEIIQPRSER